MTNEEAIIHIETLRTVTKDIPKYSGKAIDEAIDMAIKALERADLEGYSSRLWKSAYERGKADAEQKWIPVSERLPEAGEYVGDVPKYYLVQNEYGDMLVARYTHSEYWEQIYQLNPYADKIVAWMPLPEPYKAESEE